jgi:uncharacterized protein (TIGR02246 family)
MEESVRTLYATLLDAWNRRDAGDFAALFVADGQVVGFDGSQVPAAGIVDHLTGVFTSHQTAAYVAKVRWVRPLGPDAALLFAIAGLVPPGTGTVNAAVNAVQTLVAQRDPDGWRIVLFQNTPAAHHGRPDLVEAHTAELQRLLDERVTPPSR